jgi:hypothetical protein
MSENVLVVRGGTLIDGTGRPPHQQKALRHRLILPHMGAARAPSERGSADAATHRAVHPLLRVARRRGDVTTDKGCLRHNENVRCVTGCEADYDAWR